MSNPLKRRIVAVRLESSIGPGLFKAACDD